MRVEETPVHRIEIKQVYTTCSGGRTVEVYDERHAGRRYEIPASYFPETSRTKQGKRQITGYYLMSRADH
ncbi:hypothetical protein [Streptomyces sp. NPDC001537]